MCIPPTHHWRCVLQRALRSRPLGRGLSRTADGSQPPPRSSSHGRRAHADRYVRRPLRDLSHVLQSPCHNPARSVLAARPHPRTPLKVLQANRPSLAATSRSSMPSVAAWKSIFLEVPKQRGVWSERCHALRIDQQSVSRGSDNQADPWRRLQRKTLATAKLPPQRSCQTAARDRDTRQDGGDRAHGLEEDAPQCRDQHRGHQNRQQFPTAASPPLRTVEILSRAVHDRLVHGRFSAFDG